MLDGNHLSPEPQKVSERITDIYFRDGRATPEEMAKQMDEAIARAKKKGDYSKLWFETVEVETDEWGHSEGRMYLFGQRTETPAEVKRRLEHNTAMTRNDRQMYDLQRKRFDPRADDIISAAETLVAAFVASKVKPAPAMQLLIDAVKNNGGGSPQTRLHVGRLSDITHRMSNVLRAYRNVIKGKKGYKAVPLNLLRALRELETAFYGKNGMDED